MGLGRDLVELPGRLRGALGHSFRGLAAAARHQQAFRLELYAAAIATPVGLWLGRSGIERALLVGSCLLVPMVELVNSAVEATVDRIGLERHELAGRAKDLASAAVLATIGVAGVVWLLVLVSR